MGPLAIVLPVAALGVVGLVLSTLLIVFSAQRLVVSLCDEQKVLVVAIAVAGAVGSISDLVFAAAFVNDNVFDSVCRIGRYCSLFVVLSVPTTLFVNSCGRLVELRKGTANKRLAPFYGIANGIVVLVCFLLLPHSTQPEECDLERVTVLARGVYVLVLGSVTTIVNYFIYRKLQQLCTTAAANVHNRALALRVRDSRRILRCTALLTAYMMLMQAVLALLTKIDSVQIPVLDLLNALNPPLIDVLLLITLPQYRAPFFGVKQRSKRHMLEASRVMTDAESVPRIVVIRSPSLAGQRLSIAPVHLAKGQRKGISPFPPVMRHLYDASISPSASFTSTTTEIASSPPSAIWPAS